MGCFYFVFLENKIFLAIGNSLDVGLKYGMIFLHGNKKS